MPFTEPPVPSSFDIGDLNAGHIHFDSNGMTAYASDGITIIFQMLWAVLPAAAITAFTGAVNIQGPLTVSRRGGGGPPPGITLQFNNVTGRLEITQVNAGVVDLHITTPNNLMLDAASVDTSSDLLVGGHVTVTGAGSVLPAAVDGNGDRYAALLNGSGVMDRGDATFVTVASLATQSFNIPHGLGVSPTAVIATIVGAGARFVSINARTTTQFTANVVNKDGTAIAAGQTLEVMWIAIA